MCTAIVHSNSKKVDKVPDQTPDFTVRREKPYDKSRVCKICEMECVPTNLSDKKRLLIIII